MHSVGESDRVPLDDRHARQMPFSEDEVRRVRQLLIDDDRASWLRKQLKIIVPGIVVIISTCYALGTWIAAHWKP